MNRAQLLRKKATEPERILWRHLRNRNFAGYKFRRQHPFDDYVLDFYCPSANLAVELDGGGHNYQGGPNSRSNEVRIPGAPWSRCVAILESSSSPRTRQRVAIKLVCTRRATEKQSLTFILSLWQRERRRPCSISRVSQQQYHHTPTFEEEYREFLRRHGLDFDERYAWY